MEHSALKRSVLNAARAHMDSTLKELKERIQDLHSVTIGDDNSESASQTESTHGSDVELMNSLSEQREHLQMEMERCAEIDPDSPVPTVQYGAVVLTDKRNFLVATSVEMFEVEGLSFLGVTPRAPLIQAMLGKKAGDKVSFNGVDYMIKEVF